MPVASELSLLDFEVKSKLGFVIMLTWLEYCVWLCEAAFLGNPIHKSIFIDSYTAKIYITYLRIYFNIFASLLLE